MKRNLLLLAFNLLLLAAMAQTNVSGFISANTTWNLAGSPYIVTGNTLVANGYTLTIEPGVVVKFNDSTALQIDGELIAIGTATSRITFTSNQANPAAGDWGKIHFPDVCTDAVYNANGNYVSGSAMKYCNVLYGGQLGFGEIHIVKSSPYFSHCNIAYSSNAGIYSAVSFYSLEASSVKNCGGYGLYYLGFPYYSGELRIDGDTISNNTDGGVFCYDFSVYNTARITNNYFSGNTKQGALYINADVTNAVIENNYFVNNTSDWGAISLQSFRKSTISCNTFLNNQTRYGAIYNYGGFAAIVYNNLFQGNTSTPNGISSVLSIDCTSSYETTYFFNNIIRNNVCTTGVCCQFQPELGDGQHLRIYNNDFSSNTAKNILRLYGYVTGNSNSNFLFLDSNNFNNPAAQYELYNDIPYGSPNVHADNNYWGSTSTQHVDSVVYDYFNFANLSVVYYSPILSSPVVIDTACTSYVLPTGITQLPTATANFSLSPNPTTSSVTITVDESLIGSTATVTDITGRAISNNELEMINTTLQTESLPNGVYLLTITSNKGISATKKPIISH